MGCVDAVSVVAFVYDTYTKPLKNNAELGATLTFIRANPSHRASLGVLRGHLQRLIKVLGCLPEYRR
jgi:hypothetical protein